MSLCPPALLADVSWSSVTASHRQPARPGRARCRRADRPRPTADPPREPRPTTEPPTADDGRHAVPTSWRVSLPVCGLGAAADQDTGTAQLTAQPTAQLTTQRTAQRNADVQRADGHTATQPTAQSTAHCTTRSAARLYLLKIIKLKVWAHPHEGEGAHVATRAHTPAYTRPRATPTRPPLPLRYGLATLGQPRATIAAWSGWRLADTEKKLQNVQKSRRKFWKFGKLLYLCSMKDPQYVITGINQLSGEREEISHPMSYDQAQERLGRELANRRYQRYASHKRLRVERRLPVQLSLYFKNQEE